KRKDIEELIKGNGSRRKGGEAMERDDGKGGKKRKRETKAPRKEKKEETEK
ncbi:hypothetical protein M9458_057942, partial [Cirrhinus mrigala]